jgi:hypothetical protein
MIAMSKLAKIELRSYYIYILGQIYVQLNRGNLAASHAEMDG